ncbi:MAG: prolyl oligopeptidase family serine peptidase [Cyclonatronaceae bacterium]
MLFFITTGSGLFAQDNSGIRGLQPSDYHHFQFVSDTQISPDGSRVAFVRSVVSDDRRSRDSNIWMVDATGNSEPVQYTAGTSDRSPRWSHDGRQLAFLANRDGNTKVWVMPTDGGEARPLIAAEHNIGSFEWSPDGSKILVQIRSEQKTKTAGSENETGDAIGSQSGTQTENGSASAANSAKKAPEPDIHVITTSLYKANGTGILGQERNHIHVFDVAADTLRQLTSSSAWNAGGATWSADGTTIVFHADTTGNEYEGGYLMDIFAIPADSGAITRITPGGARSTSAAWSPDGKTIAFSYTEGRYKRNWIYLTGPYGTGLRNAAPTLDLIPSNLTWQPDSRHLLFQAGDRGSQGLYRVDTRSGSIATVMHGAFSISGVTQSRDGRLVTFTREDEQNLAEVYVARSDGSRETQLTRFNEALLDTLALQPVEPFWFTNEAGMRVHGFLMKPVGWNENSTWPLILNIKGGPGGMWGHQWFHENQMMAANGYAVFFTNYRGSHGYGFDHQSAVHRDYGGADYRDNMAGLDSVLARNPWIDRDRLYITGGSHGGFLTSWIISQHPGMFRAAVTQRTVTNWISEAGTQAYTPQAMQEEFGGTIWENYDYYWDRSPLKYADRITTPTLIIHSDRDQTTPIGQGEEFYYALKINGVETEMVVFRGENHGLSRGGKPVNLVERLDRILEWFGRYP